MKNNESSDTEIENLRWFRDSITKYVFPGEVDTPDAAFKVFIGLQAEVKRLRTALEKIADYNKVPNDRCGHQAIAREALKGSAE